MRKDFVEKIPTRPSINKKKEVVLYPDVIDCSYCFLEQLGESIDNLKTENAEDNKNKLFLQKWIREEIKNNLVNPFDLTIKERKDFVEKKSEGQLKKVEVDLLPNVTGCSYYFLHQLAESIDKLEIKNEADIRNKFFLQKWSEEERDNHLRELFGSIVRERGENYEKS